MTDSVERLLVRIDASTEQLRRELKAADAAVVQSASIVEKAQARMNSAWQGANKYVNQHQTELKLLGAAAVGGVAMAVKSIADYSDRYKNLQGQLKLVTSSQDELNRVYSATKSLASETGASLESTVNLYARMTRATEELGLSEAERLRLTETINKSMIVSGASTQEAEAAIRQLSQGMASGALRGEELNSVMENSPRLARAIADGLGVTIGQLRAMGKEGQLTGEAVSGALLKMGEQIDGEFTKMPMTIERAMNRISVVMQDAIGKADMSPMVDSIGELEKALNDPAIITGITNIATGLVSLSVGAVEAVAKLGELAHAYGEWVASVSGGAPAADDMDRIATKIEGLKNALATLTPEQIAASTEAQNLAKQLKELEGVYALNLELVNSSAKAAGEQAKAEKAAAAVSAAAGEQRQKTTETNLRLGNLVQGMTDAEAKAYTKLEKAQQDSAKATVKINTVEKQRVDKVKATVAALDRQLTAIGMNDRAQVIYNATMDAAEYAHGEEIAKIVEKTVALYDQQKAIDAAAQETEKAAEAAKEAAVVSAQAAEDAMQPWNDALQDMAASIDKGFSQAWTDAFSGAEDGFKGFANNMKEAFYNLLGNMAHMALTRPIVMQLSAAMGGLTGAAGAAAGTGATGSAGGISSMFSGGIGSMGASMYSGLGTMANDMGMFGVSNAFNAKALSTTGWTMGADMAGGFVGSLAAGKVFGETSGIGSAVGGIAGSALIPVPGLGAAIGSFIGAGLEKGLDNLFGQKNDGNNTGYSSFNLQKGTAVGGGVGKTYDQESVDAAQSLSQSLQLFATAIGGSSLTGRVDVGSKGIKYGNKEYGQDTEAFLQAAFDDVIRGSENLDSALKDLLIAFEGSAEETANYAQAMIMMSEAVQSNPVDVALSDMVSALESADAGISGSYYKQVDAVKDLIAKYDDSSAATVELNDALQTSRGMAYELATAILKMSDSIGTMLGDQAKYFREAVMSEDELRKARETQRDSLVTQLRTATDPQKVMELVNEFAEVNKQLFDSLNEEQRKAQVGTFTSLTAEVDTIAQSILGTALTDLKLSQDEINAQMMAAVTGAAGAMQQAADDIGGHIQTFGDYITLLVERGLKIQVDGGSLETV